MNKKIKNFLRLLKENDIYSPYLKNVHKQNSFTLDRLKESIIEINDFSDIIYMSFPWNETKEGFDFWDNIYYNIIIKNSG